MPYIAAHNHLMRERLKNTMITTSSVKNQVIPHNYKLAQCPSQTIHSLSSILQTRAYIRRERSSDTTKANRNNSTTTNSLLFLTPHLLLSHHHRHVSEP